MNRLTIRVDGEVQQDHSNDATAAEFRSGKNKFRNGTKACMERLVDYEDADESGLLLRLPSNIKELLGNVGGYMYVVEDGEITECTLLNIKLNLGAELVFVMLDDGGEMRPVYGEGGAQVNVEFVPRSIELPVKEYGKTVFLSRKEAEAALSDD